MVTGIVRLGSVGGAFCRICRGRRARFRDVPRRYPPPYLHFASAGHVSRPSEQHLAYQLGDKGHFFFIYTR